MVSARRGGRIDNAAATLSPVPVERYAHLSERGSLPLANTVVNMLRGRHRMRGACASPRAVLCRTPTVLG